VCVCIRVSVLGLLNPPKPSQTLKNFIPIYVLGSFPTAPAHERPQNVYRNKVFEGLGGLGKVSSLLNLPKPSQSLKNFISIYVLGSFPTATAPERPQNVYRNKFFEGLGVSGEGFQSPKTQENGAGDPFFQNFIE